MFTYFERFKRHFGARAILTVAIVFVLVGCDTTASSSDTTSGNGPISADAVHFGVQTKSSSCVALQTYPDRGCTPGAVFADVTVKDICTTGYSSRVRSVNLDEKKQVYAEYDIVNYASREYEVDHFIPLEIGGSNDIANLWPEPADPRPGYHEKDQVENYLHAQVCSGAMSLHDAQVQIATDWQAVFRRMMGG